MPIKTVTVQRSRTTAKIFSSSSLATVEDNYNDYEEAQSLLEDKTWTTRIVNSFHDGTNFVIVAESSYPEINEDPTGQVPIPVLL